MRRVRLASVLILATLCWQTCVGADPLTAAAARVDQMLADSWQRDGIAAAPRSEDAEFCRRVWLDLAGVAPPVMQLRRFLQDPSEDKRQRLIDQLLASPQHAAHMASLWSDILLPADTQAMQAGNAAALHQWLQSQFLENRPYDHLVGQFLTAGGASDRGPAIFYTSHSLEPAKLAAATSRIFLGIQLQCAECHDHPFDRWTQKDFWQYAAFFSQLQQQPMPAGRQAIIEDTVGGEVRLPDTDQVMQPGYPGVGSPPDEDPTNHRRRQLTIWLASRDNPYFARAAVNRVWAQLFARGIVDPVDAMDADHPPSHPELLDYLAEYFIAERFDLRTLLAMLARTDAYQRTSAVATDERPPPASFAAMTVKTLSAAQYYDSLRQNVFRHSPTAARDPRAMGNSPRDQFLSRMRAPGASPRDFPHGVVQALGMMNGPEIIQATLAPDRGLLGTLQAPLFDSDNRIETMFLATLSRPPSAEELELFSAHVDRATSPAEKLAAGSDLLWVLLNTAECAVCP